MTNNYLSANNFYPDCPGCGADGRFYVSLSQNVPDGRWLCVDCATQFDTPEGTLWAELESLPRNVRDAYIAVDVRGLPPERYGPSVGVSAETARRQAQKGRRHIDDADVDVGGVAAD